MGRLPAYFREMSRKELTDEQWERICGFLPPERGRACRPAKDNRLMVEAILRVMRTEGGLALPACGVRPLAKRLHPLQPVDQSRHLEKDL